jgi:putative ATP-dependent endonuclease of OLD family
MAKIRRIEIANFRSIADLDWYPASGVNCLIGPGDSGKSTVLDAIDLCLCARRNLGLADTDFHGLDAKRGFRIALTLGALPERLKSIESYADYLRGFDAGSQCVEDEPRKGIETVLTLQLTVGPDLEPQWSLYSDRTSGADPAHGLPWKERAALSPARLGHHSSVHFSWARNSVLNRLSAEGFESGSELLEAARDARTRFGDAAEPKLSSTLDLVTDVAKRLGVPVGTRASALLDAHSVSFSDGAVALHNADGVPLRCLGTGSSRLLIAGLKHAASDSAEVVLVDEVEYGLEPHRLMRLLHALGARSEEPTPQVFMTSHSPVVLRELSGTQLFVLRRHSDRHIALPVGARNEVQGTIRCFPEAFLARRVIVCEGASEVGLIRGLDAYWSANGSPSLHAAGVALVDTGGGDADRAYERARAFQLLGYRVAVVQDNDKAPTREVVQRFESSGGCVVSWRDGRALEDELFLSAPAASVRALIDLAVELTEDGRVAEHIKTRSNGSYSLQTVLADGEQNGYSPDVRRVLGLSSRVRKAGWFKSISAMERVAQEVIAPHFDEFEEGFREKVSDLFSWAHDEA